MKKQNEFMLLFRFEPNFDYQPSASEMEQMHQQWGQYFGSLGQQGKLVSTHQLGFEGVQISADLSTTEGIHISNNQTLGGNLIVSCETLAEAVEIGKQSPILLMGGTVEVRSIQTM